MGQLRYTVKPLEESTWVQFASLVEQNGGIFGGCWCMGFHPEGAGRDSAPEVNRGRKLDRVRAGAAHAALVFQGGDCVGWCQFGAPDELPRIKSRAAYERDCARSPDWRIAGGGLVEGYPEDAGSVAAGFLYNGALSTYEQLGFTRDRLIGKHRWVVSRTVDPVP